MPHYIAILFALPLLLLFLSCEEKKREDFERFTTGITFRNTECNKLSGCKYGSYNDDIPYKGMGLRPKHREPYIRTTRISVTKTETSVFAKRALGDHYEQPEAEAELSVEEWMSFIRNLYKCCVVQWKKDTVKWEGSYEDRERHIKRWELRIYFSDELFYEFEGNGEYPPNWDEFMQIINDLEAKIMDRFKVKQL